MIESEELLSVNEARQKMLEAFSTVNEERIPIEAAWRRVLSRDIRSTIDWPPFANSSMDGFAVREADIRNASPDNPIHLDVVADIPAGTPSSIQLGTGQAARIMTGAPLPAGADTVVPIEETDAFADKNGTTAPRHVAVFRKMEPGAYIRPTGHDLKSSQPVLHAHQKLRAQDVGLLAMLGITQIWVYRRPKIALMSTGDELLTPDQPLTPGKIHDANSYSLAALLKHQGAELLPLGIVPDQFDLIQKRLDQAADQKVDLILSSAGVSVGTFDFVRSVIEANGALSFWRVNMRPGKPVAFGNFKGIPLIGLPGNPVSAFIGFEVFVRSVIDRLSGLTFFTRNISQAILDEAIESDGRESYLRAVVEFRDGNKYARLTGHQGSGNLFSLVQANALLIVPSGVKSLPAGHIVDIWYLND